MDSKRGFNFLKSKLSFYDKKIIIASTDYDDRFLKAKSNVEKEFKNIEYLKIDSNFIKNFDKDEKEKLFNLYKDLRGNKESLETLNINFLNPNYFANLMLKQNLIDGIVTGANHSTADVLRPGFQILKTKNPNIKLISSFMWLNNEKNKGKEDLFFADVSVNPDPNSKELSEIAIQTADSVKKIFDIEPIIAMLSFSTIGSGGKHPMVIKVQEATKLVKENSDYKVIGEIQWDAAFNEKVFNEKVKNTSLKKMPNVFIFPDLNSANIGYKIASSLGSYKAVGPIVQNISKPLNDLSRGANVEEIIELIVLTAIQAINN